MDDLSKNLNGYFIMFSPWVAFFILSHALYHDLLLFFLVTAYTDLLFISQNFPFWFPSAILCSGLFLNTTLWFHKAPCQVPSLPKHLTPSTPVALFMIIDCRFPRGTWSLAVSIIPPALPQVSYSLGSQSQLFFLHT